MGRYTLNRAHRRGHRSVLVNLPKFYKAMLVITVGRKIASKWG